MHILVVSGHSPFSKRKVDLHFLADAWKAQGHTVSFIRLGSSVLHSLISRSSDPRSVVSANRWYSSKDVRFFDWVPFFHFFKQPFRFLDRLFRLYPLQFPRHALQALPPAPDVIVVESGSGLALIPLFKKTFPEARIIYSVSDRLARLNVPPILHRSEKDVLPLCYIIRVPSPLMVQDFAGHGDVRVILHGLAIDLFSKEYPSPYRTEKTAVYVGDSLMDHDALAQLATNFPDWQFHVFGQGGANHPYPQNVTCYGEVGFEEIIPYIKHAAIGLALYTATQGGDYIRDSSMKMIQYRYCGLPQVVPDLYSPDDPRCCAYKIGDAASLDTAFRQAQAMGRSQSHDFYVADWVDTAAEFLKEQQV